MKEKIFKKEEKLCVYEYDNAIVLPRKFDGDSPSWGKRWFL